MTTIDSTVSIEGIKGVAMFSADERHRYALTRRWDLHRAQVVWVLLNPSTADADQDDPTIRRCVGFSKAWGFGALTILNLFALRSTDPQALYADPADAIGPANDAALRELTAGVGLVVCGWGEHGALAGRGESVLLGALRREVHILKDPKQPNLLTAHKQPRHPLYLPACSELTRLA